MTPPPDKQPAAETLEEIAIRIVNEQITEARFGSEHSDMSSVDPQYFADRQRLVTAILSALRNERERCAKVAIRATGDSKDGRIIAQAIREGK